MKNLKLIIEQAGATYIGIQTAINETPLVYFRDPVTGSCLALTEIDIVSGCIQEHMRKSRIVFGRNGR